MTTGVRANTHHVAIGLCILLLGLLLVLDRLGVVGAEHTLKYWPVGLIIIGASIMFQAFRGEPTATKSAVPWGGIFWLLVLGFALSHVFDRRASASRGESSTDSSIFAVMSGGVRSPHGVFKRGDITTMMGGAKLDLRSVDAKPGDEIVVDVFTLMGGAVIYIPDDWNVDLQAMSFMGGIEDQRRGSSRARRRFGRPDNDVLPPFDAPVEGGEPAPAGERAAPPPASSSSVEKPSADKVEAETPAASMPPTLIVRGYVTMGGLVIKSR
jgi:hypothetical protein